MFDYTKRLLASTRKDGAVPDDVFDRAIVRAVRSLGPNCTEVEMYDPETRTVFFEFRDRNGNWLGESPEAA